MSAVVEAVSFSRQNLVKDLPGGLSTLVRVSLEWSWGYNTQNFSARLQPFLTKGSLQAPSDGVTGG
jgi:hypothetical protein